MGSTARGTWKARERQADLLFGARRNRCSGSSGRDDMSRSDSTHERLFVETKLAASNATISLFDETRKLARAEGKTPVLLLSKKGRPGFLVAIDSADLGTMLAEYAAAEANRGEGPGLEDMIRKAFLGPKDGPDEGDVAVERGG